MKELEAWLSEEGVLTGSRRVENMEFDSNWASAFRVVLREWKGEEDAEYIGEGPNAPNGLTVAVVAALLKAKGGAE